jgi:Transposase IS4
LFGVKEASESFKDVLINDLLRSLPDFEPISIVLYNGKPQNLNLTIYWHPLRLFKLFFSWEIMEIIVKNTNSYAFRNNSASKLWKSLIISELYHFFGYLFKLGLYKQSIREYCWGSNGVLSQVLLSKNRFKSILCNLHFKDRGLNPFKDNWWDKLSPIFSILRQKSSYYWQPLINLIIDEIMLKFEGRTTQKVTIPGKLISIGFKIFALGDSGYIFNWEYSRLGILEGVLTKKERISVKVPNSDLIVFLNPTQSMLIRLIKCLSVYQQKGLNFHLFLDNLFVC